MLCENNTDVRYLKYLREKKISYIFAGKDKMEITAALAKLKNIFGIETLLLEGGSIINGAFQQEGAIDELSLVTVPVVAASDSKSLFYNSITEDYILEQAIPLGNSVTWLKFRGKRGNTYDKI